MKIEYKPEALKQFSKLPKTEQKKVIRKIAAIGQFPLSGKLLQGELHGYRAYRAWPYRIIYSISEDRLIIRSIAHRQSAYRN